MIDEREMGDDMMVEREMLVVEERWMEKMRDERNQPKTKKT